MDACSLGRLPERLHVRAARWPWSCGDEICRADKRDSRDRFEARRRNARLAPAGPRLVRGRRGRSRAAGAGSIRLGSGPSTASQGTLGRSSSIRHSTGRKIDQVRRQGTGPVHPGLLVLPRRKPGRGPAAARRRPRLRCRPRDRLLREEHGPGRGSRRVRRDGRRGATGVTDVKPGDSRARCRGDAPCRARSWSRPKICSSAHSARHPTCRLEAPL